ncbi:uncharacterized protein Dana_GF26657 [Drosophila ananassae]|uniref:Uncharacterized protein n=1 Tax=Drosophila ananassae TaxID=7217 RepID=A0A0P9C2V1_DROAN|nr:uncharacterized protein Dana_GF26657 [Drosophila ananassae]
MLFKFRCLLGKYRCYDIRIYLSDIPSRWLRATSSRLNKFNKRVIDLEKCCCSNMVNNSLRWIQFCYPKRQFANSTTLKSYST